MPKTVNRTQLWNIFNFWQTHDSVTVVLLLKVLGLHLGMTGSEDPKGPNLQ